MVRKEDYLFLIKEKNLPNGGMQFRPLNEDEFLPNIDFNNPVTTMTFKDDKKPSILLFRNKKI